MTLAEHYTFGLGETVALRMMPCQSSRIAIQSRHDFLRALHPAGYHDLRALVLKDCKPWNVPAGDFAHVDQFTATWRGCDIYAAWHLARTPTGDDWSIACRSMRCSRTWISGTSRPKRPPVCGSPPFPYGPVSWCSRVAACTVTGCWPNRSTSSTQLNY